MTARATISLSILLCAGSALAGTPAAPGELTSKYASELDVSSFPTALAPATSLKLKFDFSVVRTHRYFYYQALENHVLDPASARETSFLSVSEGDLKVYAEPDQTAQVRFENLSVESTATTNGAKPQRSHQKVEPTWIGNLNQAGGFDEAQQGQRPLMELLFPTAATPLTTGVELTTDVAYDLSILGANYEAKGVRRIACTGYVMAGKRLCAKVEQTVTLVATDEEKHLRVDALGKSVCFFVPAEGRFYRSVGVMTVKLTDIPKSTPPLNKQNPAVTPTPRVTSDNFVRIILGE